jgi:hypothetical protein
MTVMSGTRRLTLVWALLLALTFGSFVIGIEQGRSAGSATAIIFVVVAMLKVRLIGIHFMDLRVAPQALRTIFEGYVVCVATMLVILDLLVR